MSVEAWLTISGNKRLCKVSVELDVMEKSEDFVYDLRNLYSQKELNEAGVYDYPRVLSYRTYTNGYTKILVFDSKASVIEDKDIEDHTPELMINVELGGLGISLISDGNPDYVDERREIMFCSLRGIQGILIDFKTERRFQLRIKQMQIDNQFAIDTNYPVTLFSHNIKVTKDQDEMIPFFNFSMVLAKDVPDVIYFKKIEFLVQKIILLADDEMVLNIVHFGNTIMNTLNTTFTGINEIFVTNHEEHQTLSSTIVHSYETEVAPKLITKIPDWKTEEISNSQYQMYIKYYNSTPLSLKISYYSTMKVESDPGFNNFMKRFGLALNTIEGAPININALELRDVVGTLNDIGYILKDRYMVRLKKNLFAILGASSLIGNPIQLVNNVSSGFKDFFYKPIEGLIDGPIEGGKGFVKGTSSLFQHTVKGTFSSASGIFSSLSKGVLVLANDKDYMKEREMNAHKERPKNMLEGFGYGIKSAAKSFGSGITGVVKMPVKGAQSKGFLGFLSGTVKGVSGLVAKPISGTMDLISKTSEGIRNHATNDEDKMYNSQRIRLPRVFYSKDRIFKTFDELHAFSFSYLVKHKKLSMGETFIDASVVCKEPVQILVL
jgi:vacuolar protein sorting-associated protein 13A/C